MPVDIGLELTPIHVAAAYEQVVARLRRAIWLGELLPGERLPSERAMAEGFEVSRLTIREALRVLQGEGLIAVRRGNSGGSMVTFPQMTAQQRHRTLVEARGRLRDVHEVRLGIEPVAARLAAERATDTQIARLHACQQQLLDSIDVPSFRRADSAFHMTIAEGSGNAMLYNNVEDARSTLFMGFDVHEFAVLKNTSANAHGGIVAAISARDGRRAAKLMTKHLEEAWAEIEAVIDAPEPRESTTSPSMGAQAPKP